MNHPEQLADIQEFFSPLPAKCSDCWVITALSKKIRGITESCASATSHAFETSVDEDMWEDEVVADSLTNMGIQRINDIKVAAGIVSGRCAEAGDPGCNGLKYMPKEVTVKKRY